jgi:hypothetical protein
MKPLEPCLLEISLVVLDAHNSIEATSRVFEIEVKQQINLVNYYSIHQTHKNKGTKARTAYSLTLINQIMVLK